MGKKKKWEYRRDFYQAHAGAERIIEETDLLLASGEILNADQKEGRELAEKFLEKFPKKHPKDGKKRSKIPQKVVIYTENK